MIASPCIDVCRMDEVTGLCAGCYRSIAEIAAWGGADEQKKILILAAVAQRRDAAAGLPRNCAER